MGDSEFLKYVGPPVLHDAVIDGLDVRSGRVEVGLKTPTGLRLRLVFGEASDVQEEGAVGMTLYALAEMVSHGPLRRFSFVNWEDDDPAYLNLNAANVSWGEVGD